MEFIKSTKNNRVKDWKKLTTKKGHQKDRAYLLDGWHLVKEAIAAEAPVVTLIGTGDQLAEHGELLPEGVETVEISLEVANYLGDTVTPQGIFAVVRIEPATLTNAKAAEGVWLFLDHVQDPGNIGTMVRTADAAGLTGVVFGRGTASQYTPKVLRAMQGSQFHVQIVEADLHEWIPAFTNRQLPVYGTKLDPQAKSYRDVSPMDNGAIVMGNEGNGMADDLLAQTTLNLYIPIKGEAESLNVAVAAGIMMFQLVQ
ncbi:TrmH family RNA methyltransferase [Levilactobacillus bambusae]|uniref:RNA methyltransferase n=1 Tax=Levilactobacillus bambusae TaxID=2024736 RepID=A0A2V1N146_9LACO|nr:RNA methyltransferase [Levilactobacillus bambusae]PWG01011.1 RNA methyltransferase [Levilactobacillus bambusae]